MVTGIHSDWGDTLGMADSADVIISAVATAERVGEIGELMGTLAVSGEAPATAVNSEYVTAPSGAVPGSCSTARRAQLIQLRRQCGSEEEFEMARSRPDWTEVACTSSSADGLPPADLELLVKNQRHFQRLLRRETLYREKLSPYMSRDPSEFGRLLWESFFFMDSGGRLEVGRKIGGGGQAEIYEALFDGEVELEWVLKVFRRDSSLADLQRQWVTQIGRNFTKWRLWPFLYLNTCFVQKGTLLEDGRFAFLMGRYWGDLRKAIDLQIVKDKTHQSPPFPLSISIAIISAIADGMWNLHENGILQRDLKAANVLLNKEIEKVIREEEIHPRKLQCHVADFESCGGVMGTGFWRAPEILQALKNKVKNKFSDPEIWTQKVDIYAYAMTSYEVLTGCVPFQNRVGNDFDGVIGGERPPLPDYVPPEIQVLLRRCWHSEPSMRPTFEEISDALYRFTDKRREFYKGLAEDDKDAEAKRWLS